MPVLPEKGGRSYILTTNLDFRHIQTSLDFRGPAGKCRGKGQGTPALPAEHPACKAAEVNHTLQEFQFHNGMRWSFFPLQELEISYQLL